MTSELTSLDQQLMISIYLRRNIHENGMTLKDYADAVIEGKEPVLTHAQFVAQFGAIDDDIALVEDWAKQNNLTVVESHAGSSVVKVSGSVAEFNKLFQIQLQTVTEDGRVYTTYTDELTIPADIQPVVETILGLDSSQKFKHHAVKFDASHPSATSSITIAAVTPVQVATAYNIPNGDGYGACVGIIELTDPFNPTGYSLSDVNKSFSRIGLIPPTVVDVLVDGATRSSISDPESMLDIYCAGAVVPRAKIICYTAPNTTQGFVDLILAIANDSAHHPCAVGISWGGPEFNGTTYLDAGFQACIVVGITCFSATGDNGANNYSCIYPSTSPYQIGAGGTSIYLKSDNTRDQETGWISGGGGVSSSVPIPTWQAGLSTRTINTAGALGTITPLTRRGVPDVSAPADPNTGYEFYINGQLNQFGGTSAAAPFLAGVITRLTQLWGRRMPFANTLFYNNQHAFTDITLGDNRGFGSGYVATPGWDASTGIGVPIGSELYKLLLVGSTFPKLNYGIRPTSGPSYPRNQRRVL